VGKLIVRGVVVMKLGKLRGLKTVGRYIGIRGVSVAVSLLIAVFLVVYVANLGGKLDELVFQEVKNQVATQLQNPTINKQVEQMCSDRCSRVVNMTFDECKTMCKDDWITQQAIEILKGMGLDPSTPPVIRMFNNYRRVIALDLGRAMSITSYVTKSPYVIVIIAEALPRTILLFTTANLIIFFTELYVGLVLSRRYGTLADKIAVSLAPLSSMPGWFYGLFLIMLLSIWPKQVFGIEIFPSRGWMSYPPPQDLLGKILDVLWHMALPILSWMIAYIPIGVYNYRTFFLVFSTEEYVEYAKARGIPEKLVLRRYILRPTLPPIITTLVLVIISSWMGAIITERIFGWEGLGTVFYQAISFLDAPVIIGITVIYAYLLAVSVVALDIIYAIVDPRVRIAG